MPPLSDLLNPISAENPSGENLKYAPLYDKIKEARREDDDAPQGDWKIERKQADWQLAIKLITEALAQKTKDLQLVVWLGEAVLKREGLASFREVLELARGLLENFWDTVYPELEDGDAELRVAPLQWLGDRLELAVKKVPITRGGLNWLQYRESRTVGTEANADSYEKQQTRQQLIDEGKLPEETFDKDFEASPKAYYVELEKTFDATLESLKQLGQLCDEKFGDLSPSFRTLQNALEEVRQTVHTFLQKKRELEPDPVEPQAADGSGEGVAVGAGGAAAAPARVAGPQTPEPQSLPDAIDRVITAARYLRRHDPYSPGSYLMLRGLRWGELRATGKSIDPKRLAAPPSEIRQRLRRFALEANWADLLENSETAMGLECGRGWLDIQRYTVKACVELGGYFEPVRRAVISELKSLLEDYPGLPGMTLMDDMPTTSSETRSWIEKEVGLNGKAPDDDSAPPSGLPRAVELAMNAANAGRPEAGVELLMREVSLEPSGRGRFQRKIQLARLCMDGGNDTVALPILQATVAEMEEKKLEEWESRELMASAFALLYRCLTRSGDASGERERLYPIICRLDPLEAMKLER